MIIGVVGLGLIGGSLAKSIKEHTKYTVWGYDINPDTVEKALLTGAIDEELTDGTLHQCDIVLVALYPHLCVEYITSHAELFGPDAVVIDCAGVKRTVFEPLAKLSENHPWTYIGGHPMAGREFSGFDHTTGTLFERASMILTPTPDIAIETLSDVKGFFLDMGFRTVRITTPEEHDEMISFTSQLAHIVSSAYIKNPNSSRHKGFSAGSFQDMTRVARLNEAMWTELFLANADLLVPSIDDFIFRLTQYREALADRNEAELFELLKEGRLMKEALD